MRLRNIVVLVFERIFREDIYPQTLRSEVVRSDNEELFNGMWLASSRTGQPVLEPVIQFQNPAAKRSSSGTGQSSRSGRKVYTYHTLYSTTYM